MSRAHLAVFAALAAAFVFAADQKTGDRTSASDGRAIPEALYVDPGRGDDANPGDQARPLKSITAAVELLPDPVEFLLFAVDRHGTDHHRRRRFKTGFMRSPHNLNPMLRRRFFGADEFAHTLH